MPRRPGRQKTGAALCGVGAHHQVSFRTACLGGVISIVENILHDILQTLVHFLECPGQAQRVLAHLQAAGGHAARVGGLGRAVEHAIFQIHVDRLRRGGHVRALAHYLAAVCGKQLGAGLVDLILRGAGQRDIAGDAPDAAAAFVILGGGHRLNILGDAGTAGQLDLLHHIQVDAVFVVDIARGIGQSHDLAAQLGSFLRGVDGHVAAAGDHHRFALKAVVFHAVEGFLGKVTQAVAGGLRTHQAAAVGKALARQHARHFVAQAFVLAEHLRRARR